MIVHEDAGGTDAMIVRFSQVKPPLGAAVDEGGAILFKGPKPDQDRRADFPVIGPQTIKNAAVAGLVGIVIEDRGVMVLDMSAVVAAATDAGLFLWVRPKGGE